VSISDIVFHIPKLNSLGELKYGSGRISDHGVFIK